MNAPRVPQVRAALLFVLLLISSPSFGVNVTFCSLQSFAGSGTSTTSVVDCLNKSLSIYGVGFYQVLSAPDSLSGTVTVVRPSDGYELQTSFNATFSCDSPLQWVNGVCQHSCPTGDVITGVIPATQSPVLLCDGSCEYQVDTASSGYTSDVQIGTIPAGTELIFGSWSSTGLSCSTATATPLNTPTSSACPTGTVDIGFGCRTYAENQQIIDQLNRPFTTPEIVPLSASAPVPSSPTLNLPASVSGTTSTTSTSTDSTGVTTSTNGTATTTQDFSPITQRLDNITAQLDTGGAPLPDFNTTNAYLTQQQQVVQDNNALIEGLYSDIAAQEESDEATLLSMFSFSPPAAVCQPWTGTVHGISVSINHCPYTELLRELIGWLFALFGAYSIFQTITKPRA